MPRHPAFELAVRSITLVPTQPSGVPASTASTSHTHGPTPTPHLKSDKQHKAPVGLIVGVALAIVAGVAGLFFIRYLFIRRARRREALAAPAPAQSTFAAGTSTMPKQQQPPPAPMATDRDAVELGHYPPSSAGGSWPTPFAAPAPAPGAGSSPAARQAYLAAELRAAQALLERGGKDVNTTRTKARIRELEERQQSAWALGLE
ncbi:hypothetical protein C8R44DRAFT_862230 [Mycena epipterygia]|nr:hypothetical protein C8R44DRAFT_862230 [Mycena epipterygia]